MLLQESRDDIRSEGERYASVIFAPASDVFVRVRPQKVTEQTTVRDLGALVSVFASCICVVVL